MFDKHLSQFSPFKLKLEKWTRLRVRVMTEHSDVSNKKCYLFFSFTLFFRLVTAQQKGLTTDTPTYALCILPHDLIDVERSSNVQNRGCHIILIAKILWRENNFQYLLYANNVTARRSSTFAN